MLRNRTCVRIIAACIAVGLLFLSAGCKKSAISAETTIKPAQPTEITPANAEDRKVDYTVKVLDENGKPIAGVTVQLCDSFCVFATTDEEGVAAFKLKAGTYHASVMVLPKGYAHVSDQTEFDFPAGATELTIRLKTAG